MGVGRFRESGGARFSGCIFGSKLRRSGAAVVGILVDVVDLKTRPGRTDVGGRVGSSGFSGSAGFTNCNSASSSGCIFKTSSRNFKNSSSDNIGSESKLTGVAEGTGWARRSPCSSPPSSTSICAESEGQDLQRYL